jgi:FKBP-type peptidyl-prolyl cis-trans isomerase
MKYKNLYLGFVFLSVLGITTTFFMVNRNNDSEISKEPIDIPLSSPGNLLGQTSNQTNNQPQASQTPQNQSNGLSVQTPGSSVRTPNNQNQLPLPPQFSVYEEYANAESPLYIDTVAGNGTEVKQGDTVAIFYKGYLTTGELFDQSRPDESGQLQPFVYQVGSGQVIPGWEATIPGMKVGSSRRLIIPSQFGYGSAGQGSIPPNAMLIFDVELAAVDSQTPTAP